MFNHNTLEKDIERLSQEVAEKKNAPEHKDYSEREIIKKVIEPMIRQSPIQQSAQKRDDKTDDEGVLPAYLDKASNEIKLRTEQLIDITFHKGLENALKEAKKSGPFVLDAFHDALADKLYEEIKRRGMI